MRGALVRILTSLVAVSLRHRGRAGSGGHRDHRHRPQHVLDFPDDAQLGERLHIFADPGDESFTLRSVERTLLCRRGVSDGFCH